MIVRLQDNCRAINSDYIKSIKIDEKEISCEVVAEEESILMGRFENDKDARLVYDDILEALSKEGSEFGARMLWIKDYGIDVEY